MGGGDGLSKLEGERESVRGWGWMVVVLFCFVLFF